MIEKASVIPLPGYPYQPRDTRPRTEHERRIANTLRSRVAAAVKAQSGRKAARTEALVGCAVGCLIAHLQSLFLPGMTLENYGRWHVDHIRPCASFNLPEPTPFERMRALAERIVSVPKAEMAQREEEWRKQREPATAQKKRENQR